MNFSSITDLFPDRTSISEIKAAIKVECDEFRVKPGLNVSSTLAKTLTYSISIFFISKSKNMFRKEGEDRSCSSEKVLYNCTSIQHYL